MILFIQTAFLGDLLLSIPTLKRLRSLYPGKRIHLICRKELASFFIENQLADEVYVNYKGKKPTWSELSQQLSSRHFDLLICPHESLRSHSFVARISAGQKIGYKKWWNSLFFDQTIERRLSWPEAIRQLSLLAPLDIDLREKLSHIDSLNTPFAKIPDWANMELPSLSRRGVTFRSYMSKQWGIPESKPYVCLAPGSVWMTKKWGDDQYKTLAKKLVQQGQGVVLLGSEGESSLGEYVKDQHPEIVNLCGLTTLTEMALVLSQAKSLICNDSGAMHMASVVQTPTIAFFGPTVQSFGYQPWNNHAQVLEDNNLKCRPCSAHGTQKCPLGTHVCMKNIKVEAALTSLHSL